MAIGFGIVLIVLGLVLVFDAVTLNLSSVNDHSLGWILLFAGVLALAVSLLVNAQRSRTPHVVDERRFDQAPPR